jgi:malate dehydrogenase (oxaloacetate-decarboxylating)(NADP+)
MNAQPIIFALANPTPEILPEEVKAVRSDALIATGRTDYPNQVNNVLCFPYIFRGALDSGATTITDAMEIAAVTAIAELAQAEQSEVVAAAYAGRHAELRARVPHSQAVRSAADDQDRAGSGAGGGRLGVALRPIADCDAYREKLQTFVYASGTTMKPIFTLAKRAQHKRVAYRRGRGRARAARGAGGGRREPRAPDADRPADVIAQRCEKFGLRLQAGRTTTWSTPSTTSATATTGRPTTA